MNTSGNKIKIFSGNSNPELAKKIAQQMGVELGDVVVTRFSDGEISVNINESVRGVDAFIIQSTCSPVNRHLMDMQDKTEKLRREILLQQNL